MPRMRACSPLVALLSLLAAASPAGAQQLRPEELAARVGIDQRLGVTLPGDLELLDENGASVALGELVNKRPVVLALVYYECPMLCGLVLDGLLSNLKLLELEPGTDFDIVTVSIDPEETPAAAIAKKAELTGKYGFQSAGLNSGWHALTGSAESIERLAETVGFRYVYDPATDEYAHGAAIMVVTPERVVSRYFYGIEYPPQDLRLGLVEASANQIGTLADQLFLLCYRYDATTGKYTFAIWAAIRIAGMATFAALAGFIVLSLRRERTELGAATPVGGGHEPS